MIYGFMSGDYTKNTYGAHCNAATKKQLKFKA